MKIIKNFKLLLLALTLVLSTTLRAQGPTLTIIHTNDTHSQVEPAVKKGQSSGGVVERASMLELMREIDPQLLYVDAGDMVQGTPYFNMYNGEVEIKAMNQQGVLLSTFGNHEFDNGTQFLADMLKNANFPILSCNYDCTGTPLEKYVKRSLIIKKKGLKIGFTGVTVNPNGLISKHNWEGIKYSDPSTSANEVAAELRKQGCDIVILISHEGYDRTDARGDRRIAAASKDIDIIIGAHSHTNLEHGYKMKNADGKAIWITQTGGKNNPIGRLVIMTGKSQTQGRKYEVKEVIADKLHPEDYDLAGRGKEMEELIAPYKEKMAAKMNEVIGNAPEAMDRHKPQGLLGNFTSDALRVIGEKLYGHKMDVGLMNFGGLRTDLDKGDVTVSELFQIFPFENTVAILELKGKDLEAMIKGTAGHGLEALSGTNVTLEKEGDRIYASEVKINGEDIDPEKIYYVATIDYLAEGNDGVSPLRRAVKNTNTHKLLRDEMIEYVRDLTKQGKLVESKVDNRVKQLYEETRPNRADGPEGPLPNGPRPEGPGMPGGFPGM